MPKPNAIREIIEWFLKAAEAGYELAIKKVIECYKNGIGVKKNSQNAGLWSNKLRPNKKIPIPPCPPSSN